MWETNREIQSPSEVQLLKIYKLLLIFRFFMVPNIFASLFVVQQTYSI